MARITLTVALGDYDRTRRLIDGTVKPEGVDLCPLVMNDAFDRHDRMIRFEEFDVCELSMSSFLMARDRGRALTAIPVFPYRMFRHQFVLCHRDAGIRSPQDLKGKRIGINMYQVTTALWVRGFLQHEYGVSPRDLHWFTDRAELVPVPPEISVTVAHGRSLEQMLLEGDLDALILIESMPDALLQAPQVHRLFPDYPAVEADYYRKTGIYPIMHALVCRDEILARHPWVARNLYDAFVAAKQMAYDYNQYPRVHSLAWAEAYRKQEEAVFGPDPYAYGIQGARPTLEALVQYSHEQGLTSRRFTVEELFAPSTHSL